MADPSPNLPKLSNADIERFLAKIAQSSPVECWEWTGTKDTGGYGVLKISDIKAGIRQMVKAHRVSYLLHYGQDPGRFVVMHSCDNPSCNNPLHLSLGTSQENTADKCRKSRHVFGSRSGRAILTEHQASKILTLYERAHGRRRGYKERLRRRISKLFCISEVTVQKLVHRKTWRRIT